MKKSFFHKDGWFNKILRLLFKRQIIVVNGNQFYYYKGRKLSGQCVTCKDNYYKMPMHDGRKYGYQYRIDENDTTSASDQFQFEDANLKIYGWVVEYRYKDTAHKDAQWYQHHNKRVYDSRVDALDAISQSKKGYYVGGKMEYRIRPLYEVDHFYYRNLVISRILDKKGI